MSAANAAPKPCVGPAAGATISATFTGATSLRDLVTWVAGFTCKPVVYPSALERTASRIVVVAPAGGMTPTQALALFVEAMGASGVVVAIKPDAISLKLDPTSAAAKCPPVATPVVAPIDGDEVSDVQALIDAGTLLDDPTHARIARVLVNAILANPLAVAKSVRVVPWVKNGVASGFKLYAIRPSSVFAKVGFSNGDAMIKINGIDLSTPLQAFDALRTADHFDIEIIRRGKPLTIEIDIVDSL